MEMPKDMIMDHCENLKKLCRVCGEKIILKTGYKTAKLATVYTEQLANYFDVKLKTDVSNIHPTALCVKCNLKLYKLKSVDEKKTLAQHKEGEPSTSQTTQQQFIESFKFDEHKIDCALCTRIGKRGRKPSFKPHRTDTTLSETLSNTTIISSEAKNSGFQISGTDTFLLPETDSFSKEIVLLENSSWELKIFGKTIPSKQDCGIPTKITKENASEFFTSIKNLKICKGNSDFKDLIDYKLNFSGVEHFKGNDEEISGFIQTRDMKSFDDLKVIRHTNCELAFRGHGERCKICTKYRANLFAIRTRINQKDVSGPSSLFSPDRYLLIMIS